MKPELERLLGGDVTAEMLAEKRDQLDELTPDEKIDFASRLAATVPSEDLSKFARAIEALRRPRDDAGTFHDYISRALHVRQRLEKILDAQDPYPHRLLLHPHFNIELYKPWRPLCNTIISQHIDSLVARLSQSTPSSNRRELVDNVNQAFGEHSLFTCALQQTLGSLPKEGSAYSFFAVPPSPSQMGAASSDSNLRNEGPN